MPADLTTKYRTRAPPKEHEEAVRMLLEGIGAKQVDQNELSRQTLANTIRNNTHQPTKGSYEYDRASLNSAGSSLSEAHVEPPPAGRNGNLGRVGNNALTGGLRSKATSTSESALSSASMEHDAAYREPIPSRTIAVQCDLKSSSALRRDSGLTDGSMQVSSISSTKYGFYNFTPETLENRRKLQRSVSSRNVAPPSMVDSRQAAANQQGTAADSRLEVPTFISDVSSPSSLLASDDDRRHRTRAFGNGHHHQRPEAMSSMATSTANGGRGSSSDSTSKTATTTTTNNHHRKQTSGSLVRGATIYASTLDNSRAASNIKARLDSLPRRPMTALSYVSATKLRGQTSPDRSSNGSEPRVQPIKNRALSQQVLSTPAAESRYASSGSDSETSGSIGRNSFRPTTHKHQQASMQHPEHGIQLLAAKPAQKMPIKPPRPTLVSSVHNEQVQDFKALDRIGTRPANNHQHAHQEEPSTRARTNRASTNGLLTNDGSNTLNSLNWRSSSTRAFETAQSRQAVEDEFEFKSPYVNGRAELRDDDNYNSREGYSNRNHQDHSGRTMETHYSMHPNGVERRGLGSTMSNGNRINSTLSLSRRASRPLVETTNYSTDGSQVASGYYTASHRPHTLSREDRAHSQTLLSKPSMYRRAAHRGGGGGEIAAEQQAKRHLSSSSGSEVCRSTSMRQIGTRNGGRDGYGAPVYTVPNEHDVRRGKYFEPSDLGQEDLGSFRGDYRVDQSCTNGSDNSESPLTRTWANPSAKSTLRAALNNNINTTNNNDINCNRLGDERKSSRSFSVRNVNDDSSCDRYEANSKNQQSNGFSSCNSSSESYSMDNARRFVGSHQLDYDSQHRLNESGLPEIDSATMNHQPRRAAAASYLGVTGRKDALNTSHHLFSSGRSPQITGRAMSQQSLTRPTMPLVSGRRRFGGGAGTGSNSGSDVGGSSMSLVSRLHGRYENAHTRSPIVMYIPQATPRPSLLVDKPSAIGKSSTLRKSSRSRQKSSSHDRSRRSLSRNESDSESSSMLRTLVRPRNRIQGNYASKRATRMNDRDADEEDLDNLGQLATEVDSYKFRRRYSVPKDAKINWFAKLKQRVTAGAK